MSTTALFIELLIIGLQAAIWLALLVLSILGYHWISPERIKGFEAMFAVLLLPIVYPAGIFIDYVADVIFSRWERRIRAGYPLEKDETALRLMKENNDPSLAAHFGYLRSRIRLSRSSALNFTLITIMGLVFVITRCRNVSGFPFWRTMFLEVCIGGALAGLAVLAWRYITHSFHKWVAREFGKYSDTKEIF